MSVVHALYSTPPPSLLHDKLEGEYGLKVLEIRFLKRGFNDTYLVRTGKERFILRLFRQGRRSESEIRSELNWLCFLQEKQVPVSGALHDKKGGLLQTLDLAEGIRFAALFSFAEGKMIRKPDITQCYQAGEALGKLHKVSLDYNPGPLHWDYRPEQVISFVQNSIANCMKAYPADLQWLDETANQIRARLSGVQLQAGLCHGDLQAENFYYEQDTVRFIDFDFCGPGPLLYDLGAYTWYDHRAKTKEMLARFYAGYASQMELNRTQENLIPVFGMLRALFLMGMWNRFNDGIQNPEWPAEQVHQFIQKLRTWSIK
ncbi:MAG: phosphotransferase enzyme family protein [Bacteroidia bacterium]